MSIENIDTLLAVLRRTQILSDEQVDEIMRELVPIYRDANALAEYLVEIDWLTEFQLRLLFTDQWRDLVIGPFQILDCLGEGGICEVYKAWDTTCGRLVALKVLKNHLSNKHDIVHQFHREVHSLGRLHHPNIIRTFDSNHDAERKCYSMEYVEGMDLDRYIRDYGPLTVDLACDFARQIAQGLQHAHQIGLVHRDIKPANLLLVNPPMTTPCPSGRRPPDPVVKIIDWGLARCIRESEDTHGTSESSSEQLDSEKGSLIGTADYIAPEQARDPTLVDVRADLYSLGCTLIYLLTGAPPFDGSTLMHKLLKHQEEPAPSVMAIRPDVPQELDDLIRKMLEKNPADRPQIPLLVIASLRQILSRYGNHATPYRGTPILTKVNNPASSTGLPSPGSRAALPRPGLAPGTVVNLPRPLTHSTLVRPGTRTDLPHPGQNGNGTVRR